MYRIYLGNNKVKLLCNPEAILFEVDSRNETKSLLNGLEVNTIKRPALTNVTMNNVPLFNKKKNFLYNQKNFHKSQYFLNHFENLKASKKPFSLIITRYDFQGKKMFKTAMKVTLESYKVSEEFDNGNDIYVDLSFKKWQPYGNRKLVVKKSKSGKKTATVKKNTRTSKKVTSYTIKEGDTLSLIAKKTLGNTKYWTNIYNSNVKVIEGAAKKRGKPSSKKGTFLVIGTKLKIPSVKE